MPDCLQITLVRHGESALPFPGWLTLPEFRDWIAEYNRTGIAAGSRPTASLTELAAAVSHIVCSDLPRAVDSAQRLAPAAVVQTTPLLREAGRPAAGNCRVRLPLRVWDAWSQALWRRGLSRTDESISQARERATAAARMLVELATTHERIVAVGHGMFSRMVADELVRARWRGPEPLQLNHWGFATYEFAQP